MRTTREKVELRWAKYTYDDIVECMDWQLTGDGVRPLTRTYLSYAQLSFYMHWIPDDDELFLIIKNKYEQEGYQVGIIRYTEGDEHWTFINIFKLRS